MTQRLLGFFFAHYSRSLPKTAKVAAMRELQV